MMPCFGSVLLVERHEPDARAIAKLLICAGFSVKVTDDPEHAFSLVRAHHFDALVLEFSSSCNEIEDLRRWAGEPLAAARVALIAEQVSASLASAVTSLGIRLVLQKPPDLDALLSFVTTSARTVAESESFSGNAEQIDLLSYVQFLVLDRKKTVLEVSSFDGSCGEIFISNGEILHVRFGEAQGEAALFQCLGVKGGRFAHRPWYPPMSATISRSPDALLFEAARIRDESKPDPS